VTLATHGVSGAPENTADAGHETVVLVTAGLIWIVAVAVTVT
jgi:hypothetical protein